MLEELRKCAPLPASALLPSWQPAGGSQPLCRPRQPASQHSAHASAPPLPTAAAAGRPGRDVVARDSPPPTVADHLPCRPAGTTTRSTLCATTASTTPPTRSRDPCASSSSSSWSAPAPRVRARQQQLCVSGFFACRRATRPHRRTRRAQPAAPPPCSASASQAAQPHPPPAGLGPPGRHSGSSSTPPPVKPLSPPPPLFPFFRVLWLPDVQGAGPPPAEPRGGGDFHAAGTRRGTPRRLRQQGPVG